NFLRFGIQDSDDSERLKLSYFNNPGEQPLVGETLGQALEKRAKLHGNNEAIVFCQSKIRKTYAEFNADVDKFAAGLLAIGLVKGDRIGIWSPNHYEWVVTQFAAGLILVLINPAYQPRELEYCLNKVGVRALVAAESFKTQDYYKILTAVVQSLPDSKAGHIKDRLENFTHVIMISEKKYGGCFNFVEVSDCGQSSHIAQLRELENQIQFDDAANIQFTSGTTRFPKGTTLSHFNLINNCYIFGRCIGYDNTHRICVPNPLYHTMGCGMATLCAVLYGACLVYPGPSVIAKSTYQAVHDEKCTSLYGTPTMFIDVLGVMAGSTCPVELLKGCINKLNISNICVAYGTTECSPVITKTKAIDTIEQCTTTVGRVLEHTQVKLVDSISLRIVPVGATGELWARGYLVMREYWNDRGKTEESITQDGWYRTGDLATVDEAGYFKIVGRMKDMINRGGEKIYPREIEEFLHTHPKIAETHVVGVPDERLGEELCAWVKLKAGETLTTEEVKAFCKGNLSQFKIPRYIKFVDKFPLTVTGKVQKFIIRDQATTELKLKAV
uniref:Medium-chain acyl-CoA ligase ACSF2, mitochondrial n=1 Tax=Strigamia maritima TaxID=126957 RepID=T1IQX2_STRMM